VSDQGGLLVPKAISDQIVMPMIGPGHPLYKLPDVEEFLSGHDERVRVPMGIPIDEVVAAQPLVGKPRIPWMKVRHEVP